LYYPTVLVIAQKARETSTNIPRYCTVCYCTVGYCTVPWARSSCYSCSFLSSYWKRMKKVKLDNKSLIRCFGMKYRRISLLVVCILTRPAGSSKYSTIRKNIRRHFTPKHLIRYMKLFSATFFISLKILSIFFCNFLTIFIFIYFFNSVFNIFNVTSVKRFWTFRILALYKYFIIIIIIIMYCIVLYCIMVLDCIMVGNHILKKTMFSFVLSENRSSKQRSEESVDLFKDKLNVITS